MDCIGLNKERPTVYLPTTIDLSLPGGVVVGTGVVVVVVVVDVVVVGVVSLVVVVIGGKQAFSVRLRTTECNM